ncbi:GNAT family N-acetyltransferase [Actinoplanes regularis]|uniref:GNAT family N-acetyltransferase n=1 Tax=Actinoplanes regularis TaxID=52697 RepID=UPI0024A0A835|nr:GNAT family N-acetyltransferase [Actinoplanes regularis]GLW30429.1 N-acetyltransferase [Actinoplanes regularis]
MTIELVPRFTVDDRRLSALHARAFNGDPADVQPWLQRLTRHALTWIGAFEADRLIGFVQVCWDGGSHAFLLDTAVDPEKQHRGIGAALVEAAAEEVRAAGCEWLHVDFEPHLEHFYLDRCHFEATRAGLIRLKQVRPRPSTAGR